MFQKILNKIKPTEQEEKDIITKADYVLKRINSKLINGEATLGGSLAKGTWLKSQHDIDVFVKFNKKENMSARVGVVIAAIFDKYEKIHGSRDYYIVDYEGVNVEFIPVLNIESPEQAENITDVSPMHVTWVKKNTNEKLRDEIRLAKYFLQVNKLYGAETYIGGFSGYLVELLVIKYGNFLSFIKEAAKWKNGEIIEFGKNKFESKQEFPLTVIDPVQPNRNTSAAMKEEVFDKFVELAKKFSAKPSDKFFKETKINLKKYDLVLKIAPLKGNKDVVGTKVLKVFERINASLNTQGFKVTDSGWYWTDFAYLYFKVKNKKLSSKVEHFGPPIKFEKEAKNFRNKYEDYKVTEKNGKLVVTLPRKYTKVKEAVISILSEKEVEEKVSTITFL
jgi:tRNA nucleotidyltransferase (CCA-adding enzyme)